MLELFLITQQACTNCPQPQPQAKQETKQEVVIQPAQAVLVPVPVYFVQAQRRGFFAPKAKATVIICPNGQCK